MPVRPPPAVRLAGQRRLVLVLAYDGSAFSGFARQPGRRTVQGVVEDVLGRLAGRPVGTVGAGRTDAGVHARCQVVHADVPARLVPERARAALNAISPALVARYAGWAASGFDARFSALRRVYCYRLDDRPFPDPLLRGWVLPVRRPLAVPAMRAAARHLLGEHDFAAFCRRRAGTTTVRRVRALTVRRDGRLVLVRVSADAFCHQMVRSIVHHLVAVGEGRRDPAATAAILAAGDRARVGGAAPPHGLVLEAVVYPARLLAPELLRPDGALRKPRAGR